MHIKSENILTKSANSRMPEISFSAAFRVTEQKQAGRDAAGKCEHAFILPNRKQKPDQCLRMRTMLQDIRYWLHMRESDRSMQKLLSSCSNL